MIPWDKLHGAMTHFPIALLLFSTACDLVSVTFKKLAFARGLRLVSFYSLAVAAPSLLKLQISGAHMALVIHSGIKDEMPSFAKKYNERDTAAIVAYLKTLH
jgi:uncharacterized membrane protein